MVIAPGVVTKGKPARDGGTPIFADRLPVVRPSIADPAAIASEIESVLSSGMLTNAAHVRELESRAAEYLGVKHCVAVASCTAGLMLVLQGSHLSGEVICPSFTFAATAHAIVWNGLTPVWADIDERTLTLSTTSVERAIGPETSAILAVHTFGTPGDIDGLMKLAKRADLKLIFDAAHAFGSRWSGSPVGRFGNAEVFSLSPTKVLVAGEGGIVATDDDSLAEHCRIGRDYGNPGDYDCLFPGFNARMSELHAAVALASLRGVEETVEKRNSIAGFYEAHLAAIPGIRLAEVRPGDRSTYKDFTVIVDAQPFGMSAAELATGLAAEGIETRRYYAPPVHTMRAYRHLGVRDEDLGATNRLAEQVLTLPMWPDLAEWQVGGVAGAIRRIHEYAR